MLKSLLSLILFFCGAQILSAQSAIVFNENLLNDLWGGYKSIFNKTYSSTHQDIERRSQFFKNLNIITEHNFFSNTSYRLTVNKFSDQSFYDLKKNIVHGNRVFLHWPKSADGPAACSGKNLNQKTNTDFKKIINSVNNIPSSFDWRERNVITRVKDQGLCGSCWAFSVAGVIESIYNIKTNTIIELSEQFIIDCLSYEPDGCDGGYLDYVYAILVENRVWPPNSVNYPNTGGSNTCNITFLDEHSNNRLPPKCVSFLQFDNENEDFIMKIIALFGPVSAAVEVSEDMMMYGGGVLRSTNKNINHAIIIVGYGFDKILNLKYWIVKNSWGDDWGEGGYMRIARGENSYGISSNILLPIVEV